MKTKQSFILFAAGLLLLAGCTKEQPVETAVPGDTAIELSGITRNDGVNGANLYLKAFLGGNGGPYPYFGEMLFSVNGGLSDQVKPLVFPGAKPYYPLGNQSISLFAFSGKLDKQDRMIIKAGNGSTFDALLSNQGETQNLPGLSGEGAGTPGSSSSPATILHFRHVMTRVTVSVVVDETENPPVDPKPASVQFRMGDVAAQGFYSIRATSEDPAVDWTGNYTMTLGDNYLVPNGRNLANAHFTYLKIDDYTATGADLGQFTVAPVGQNPDQMVLMPGYAYELEIKVQKLRVTGVTVRLVDWNRREVPGDNIEADSYPLALSLGNYANSEEDAITKVILHTADRLYAGETMRDGSGIGFVRLPASGTVKSVEFYTQKGQLLRADNLAAGVYQFNNTTATLTLPMSKGGMFTADGNPYSDANPYMVMTPLQLLNIAREPSLRYRQGQNLNMSELTLDQANSTFGGIDGFTGEYDGNGFMIAELNATGPGLFTTNGGTIRNIRVFSGTVDATGQPYAGGICGTNNGTIVAAINSAQVTGSSATAGGIAGLNGTDGIIVASLNTGNVPAGTNVGGICGENRNMTARAVTSCVNTGMLNGGATLLGGLCGMSTSTPNEVFHTSFWLVGSAEHTIGITGIAVGSSNTGLNDCSALDPLELRAVPTANESTGTGQVPLERLNQAITDLYPTWNTYQFVNDPATSGLTWPTPMKTQP